MVNVILVFFRVLPRGLLHLHSMKIINIVSNFCRLRPVSFIPSVFYITQSEKVSCGIAYNQMETMPEASSKYFDFWFVQQFFEVICLQVFICLQAIIATLF